MASAEASAEKEVLAFAERRLNLLSESQPKKVEEMMPGMLKLLWSVLRYVVGRKDLQRD